MPPWREKLGRLEGIKGGVRGKNLGRISIFPKEVALIQSKPITYRILKTTKNLLIILSRPETYKRHWGPSDKAVVVFVNYTVQYSSH